MQTKVLTRRELRVGNVIKREKAPRGITKPHFVTMPSIRAIVKKEGQNMERVAHIVDQILGWNLTPVTVLRDYTLRKNGKVKPHSFQVLIENSNTFSEWLNENNHYNYESPSKYLRGTLLEQWDLIRVFDYLLTNADRHNENLLIEKSGEKLWAIDHGRVMWLEPNTSTYTLSKFNNFFKSNPKYISDIKKLQMILKGSSTTRKVIQDLIQMGHGYEYTDKSDGLYKLVDTTNALVNYLEGIK